MAHNTYSESVLITAEYLSHLGEFKGNHADLAAELEELEHDSSEELDHAA